MNSTLRQMGSTTLPIQFLYFEDCPSHEMCLERLRQALADTGLQADIAIIRVETEEQAQQLHFPGSPTILIAGQDLFPGQMQAVYALTCRAYQVEDGRISPLPSAAMLRSALQRVAAQQP